MKALKMHGAGNDFIIINNIEEKLPKDSLSALAKELCERRLNVGADGMMVVEQSDIADFAMLFFNSDGSIGEMCGNGARCICRYGHDFGLSGDVQKIETTAGIVTGERITDSEYRIRLNDPSVFKSSCGVTYNGITYECSYIELGNPGLPHAVVRLDDFEKMDPSELFNLGKALRSHPDFPKGANVSFIHIAGENRIVAKTFERGVEDFTLACGTGAGSICLSSTRLGYVSGKNVAIEMPGGTLHVTVTDDGELGHDIFLTGPTKIVAGLTITR